MTFEFDVVQLSNGRHIAANCHTHTHTHTSGYTYTQTQTSHSNEK